VLKRLHPVAKLAACLAWVAAASLILDPLFLGASLGLAVLLLLGPGGVRAGAAARAAATFALFGFGFLTTAVLFRMDGGYVAALSAEAALRSDAARAGVSLFLRAMACGMISYLFAATTDAGALARAAMAQAGLPPRLGYALFATLNAAPEMAADLAMLRRGRAMRRGRTPSRLMGPREAAALAVPLLAAAIRRASDCAVAMEARGLSRDGRPRVLGAPPWRGSDTAATLLAAFALAAAVAATRG
jgi:energy-coupling factor transport system permease protein